jgi:hypothetical protein
MEAATATDAVPHRGVAMFMGATLADQSAAYRECDNR